MGHMTLRVQRFMNYNCVLPPSDWTEICQSLVNI